MTNLTQEDLNAIYSVCPVCRDRVFLLESGFEVDVYQCERCGAFTALKEDFHIDDDLDVVNKLLACE